jgi:transposase-like protein
MNEILPKAITVLVAFAIVALCISARPVWKRRVPDMCMGGEVEVAEADLDAAVLTMNRMRHSSADAPATCTRTGATRRLKGAGQCARPVVMGLLERHGIDGHSTVTLKHLPTTRRRAFDSAVREHVEPGSEVFTDALPSYDALKTEYAHKVIDHAESYAEGKVHTNGLENFWSLLKRSVKGTYVSVEPFHLFRYLDEQAYRFNTRKMPDGEQFVRALHSAVGKRLMYEALTGGETTA